MFIYGFVLYKYCFDWLIDTVHKAIFWPAYSTLKRKRSIDTVHKAIFWPAYSTLKRKRLIDTVHKAIFWPIYTSLKRKRSIDTVHKAILWPIYTSVKKERLTQCTKLYSDLHAPLLKEIDEEIDTVYKAIFWPTYSTLKRDWLTRAQSYILILTYILHSSKTEPLIALDSQQMGTYNININGYVMTVAWQPASFQNTQQTNGVNE